MAKVKSFITEADIAFMTDVSVEYVSLVGHAANRQPFKIIKGEIKGDHVMPKQAIHSILVSKDVTEEKLQEIVTEHNFSVETKVEDGLEGYVIYKQIEDNEVEFESRKMSALADGVFAIVADLKEDSEKAGIEKEEMEYESLEKVADALFAMMDVVLGTMRQPQAEGQSRKDMIMSAVKNFTSYTEAVLATVKAEDILAEVQIKSEIINELRPVVKEEIQPEVIQFDSVEFETKIKADLEAKFTEMLEEKIKTVMDSFVETKDSLNTSLNEQFAQYQKKEETGKEIESLKSEIEGIKNTTKSRQSEIDEVVKKKTAIVEKKTNTFVTFV